MYLLKVRFPHSYDERSDSFGNMNGQCRSAVVCEAVRIVLGVKRHRIAAGSTPNKPPTNQLTTITVPGEFGALLYLAVPCFVLAVIFHPGAFRFCFLRPKANTSHMCHPCPPAH